MPSVITNRRVTITGSTVAGTTYDSEAQALFDRMTVEPNTDRKDAINDFFVGVKGDLNIASIADAFDCIWFTAAHDQQASRLNWVKNAHNLTEFNIPTWTLDRGYTGNGTTMYLHTNYIPSDNGINFILNNGSFGSYYRQNIAEGAADGSPVCNIHPRFGDGNFYVRINSGVHSPIMIANSQGLSVGIRDNAIEQRNWKNGVLLQNNAVASSSLDSTYFTLLARHSGGDIVFQFTTRELSFSFIGNGTLNQLNLYSRVQTYLTTLGAQV